MEAIESTDVRAEAPDYVPSPAVSAAGGFPMNPRDGKSALGLGLAGAHRTGKSTMASILAERSECPLISSAGQAIAESMDFKVYPGMPLAQRRVYQERVLEAFVIQWEQEDGLFVCDRTPLDFAAYAMADYRPEEDRADDRAWLADYVDRCVEATKRFFFSVFVVQPGIPYAQAPGKPAPDLLYQETVAALILNGAMRVTDGCNVSVLGRGMTDLDQRVDYVERVYSSCMRAFIVDGKARSGVH